MYTNLSSALNKNVAYQLQLAPALEKAVSSPHKMVFEKGHLSAWIEEDSTHRYLFYRKMDLLTIFLEEKMKYDRNPFKFELGKIANFDDALMNVLLQVSLNKKGRQAFDEILPSLRKFEAEFKAFTDPTSEQKSLYRSHLHAIVDQSYYDYGSIIGGTGFVKNLVAFHHHLLRMKYLEEPIPDAVLDEAAATMALSSVTTQEVRELLPRLISIRAIALEHGFTSSNPHKFNDGDAEIWAPALPKSICFSSQNIKFFAISRNNDADWLIIHFGSEYSSYSSESDVLRALGQKEIKNKDRVLLVRDGAAAFVGDNYECMLLDAEYSLDELMKAEEE